MRGESWKVTGLAWYLFVIEPLEPLPNFYLLGFITANLKQKVCKKVCVSNVVRYWLLQK